MKRDKTSSCSCLFLVQCLFGYLQSFYIFFTRDISYFIMWIYIFGLIIHHLMYTGIANIYLFDYDSMFLIVSLASVIVALPIYAFRTFTKSFYRQNSIQDLIVY